MFLAALYALCAGSSGLLLLVHEFLPSLHTSVCFCASSFDHQHLVKGNGLVFWTVASVVSAIAAISVLSLL